jgi:excisionase family DNA binding protein
MELLVSTRESARRLGIGKTTFFELLKNGRIKAVRLGGRTLVPPAELERFTASLPRRTCTNATVQIGDSSNSPPVR